MDSSISSLTPYQYLSSLEKCFSSIPLKNAPIEVQTVLQPISNFQQIIKRQDKQITFFGVFKAGKSTLLNAIIGRDILPSRVNRATGTITKIRYASQVSASIITQDSESNFLEKPIFFDDLSDYILLDVSSSISKAPEGIKEVFVQIPLPLIEHNCILVDSPGLMDNPVLTERSYQEIEKSDLAVMVLRADKLLSEVEREAAERLHELLNGNIVFIVNHLGLVDESEQEEILDWVNTSLGRLGNSFVGQPCIFTTDAKAALERKNNGTRHTVYSRGLLKFEQWLEGLLKTPTGQKVAVLSRLGVLESYLWEAQAYFQSQFIQKQVLVKDLEKAETEALEKHQTELQKIIDSDRLNISGVKTRLYQFGDSFVKESKENAKQLMNNNSQWQEKLNSCFDSALNLYIQSIYREVESSVTQTKVKIPAFDLDRSSFLVGVSSVEDRSGRVGRWIGGGIGTILQPGGGTIAGAFIGTLVGKALFGVDIKQKTLDLVEQTAREMVQTMTSQAEKYIDLIEELLVEYAKSKYPYIQPSRILEETRQLQDYYNYLIIWCKEFQNGINKIKQEVSA